MQCPKCSGPCWDNRTNKRNPKMPDYRCKDRDNCDGAVWLTAKNGNGTGSGPHAPTPQNGASTPHAVLYKLCVQYVKKEIVPLFSPDMADCDILASAATLFIQASKGGVVFAPKVQPAPAAPPPPPPEPVYSGDDLPF